jgi:hypothetical protein
VNGGGMTVDGDPLPHRRGQQRERTADAVGHSCSRRGGS